jgi:4-carboxymuconolactone decarboxylase
MDRPLKMTMRIVLCVPLVLAVNGALAQQQGSSFSENRSRTVQPTQPQRTAPPSAGQKLFGDVAPKFAELTDNVLFGDVWARPGLSPRDRSLITVAALIAMNRPDQLRAHLARARDNGVTQDELVETITHLAFYAGWPSAVTAVGVAREVFQQK